MKNWAVLDLNLARDGPNNKHLVTLKKVIFVYVSRYLSPPTEGRPPKQRVGAKLNASLVVPGALAHRLQRRTTCKIQNGLKGAPKWPTWSGNVSFFGTPVNFRYISFLI